MTADNSIQALRQAWNSTQSLETEIKLIVALVRADEIDQEHLSAACACQYKPALTAAQQLNGQERYTTPHRFDQLNTLSNLGEFWECHVLLQMVAVYPERHPQPVSSQIFECLKLGRKATRMPIPKRLEPFHQAHRNLVDMLAPCLSRILKTIGGTLAHTPPSTYANLCGRFYMGYLNNISEEPIGDGIMASIMDIDPRPLMQAREAYFAAIHSIMPAMLGYGQLPELAIPQSS